MATVQRNSVAQARGLRAYLAQITAIIIIASVLAIGLFLALPYLQNRPDFPAGTFPIIVEGNPILVEMDPAKEVIIWGFLPPLVTIAPPTATPQTGLGGQVGPGDATPIIVTLAPTAIIAPATPIPPTAAPPAVDSVIFIDYVVQPGDTLYRIGLRRDTSIPLMARFGISAHSLIPGKTIRLPVGNPAYCSGGYVPYAITDDETAASIARHFGTTVDTLRQVNRLDGNATIYTGSVICVPG
jgi:LysM repeat protein